MIKKGVTIATKEHWRCQAFARRVATTDALGNVVFRIFDPFGNVTAEWGATYPVEMDYDSQSRRVALRTTRDGTAWDETRWTYDAATGSCTSKTYADGSTVAYTCTPDRLDAGYSLTLSNGVVFTRSLLRDGFRRSLVTGVANSVDGAAVEDLAYVHDALGRPIVRNGDTFGYNARGEVVFATVAGNVEAHGYDGIGNSTIAAFNGATNACTANGLNQYASIACASASPCETAVEYDLDGNMTQCGEWTYTYDAENRLKAVSSNDVLLVTNFYDAKGRRVRKVTLESTMTFFYDGRNLIEERVANANGTASAIHYYWGKDLSGKLQGAGGVGGLLYLTVDGAIYIPCYDGNGNVTRYLDANGTTVAQYVYDAFGRTISQTGPRAHVFRHRFSTKYFDAATGLYYYGHRFYSPVLRRWLTRDPIEEDGGLNLYGFCGNNAVCRYDKDGRAYFIKRSMFGVMYRTAQRDIDNQEWVHEQLVFEDGNTPNDVGYFGDGRVKEDPGWRKSRVWVRVPGRYNDCVMRKVVQHVRPGGYKMCGEGHYNCQDYADDLRAKYGELIRDRKVRCECGLSK